MEIIRISAKIVNKMNKLEVRMSLEQNMEAYIKEN